VAKRVAQGVVVAAEKELPIAEEHLAKAQSILGESILPEKLDVIPAPNEFMPGHRAGDCSLSRYSMWP
jgi:hypothetical protein